MKNILKKNMVMQKKNITKMKSVGKFTAVLLFVDIVKNREIELSMALDVRLQR